MTEEGRVALLERGRRADARGKPTTPVPARFAWTTINGFVNIARMDWEIVYYSDDVQEAILAFPPGLQARYILVTERMLTFGPNLGMPHSRAMGKGLFELRLKSKEGLAYFDRSRVRQNAGVVSRVLANAATTDCSRAGTGVK
jgi:hypothetical protein